MIDKNRPLIITLQQRQIENILIINDGISKSNQNKNIKKENDINNDNDNNDDTLISIKKIQDLHQKFCTKFGIISYDFENINNTKNKPTLLPSSNNNNNDNNNKNNQNQPNKKR